MWPKIKKLLVLGLELGFLLKKTCTSLTQGKPNSGLISSEWYTPLIFSSLFHTPRIKIMLYIHCSMVRFPLNCDAWRGAYWRMWSHKRIGYGWGQHGTEQWQLASSRVKECRNNSTADSNLRSRSRSRNIHSRSAYAFTVIYCAKLRSLKETFRSKLWPKI